MRQPTPSKRVSKEIHWERMQKRKLKREMLKKNAPWFYDLVRSKYGLKIRPAQPQIDPNARIAIAQRQEAMQAAFQKAKREARNGRIKL